MVACSCQRSLIFPSVQPRCIHLCVLLLRSALCCDGVICVPCFASGLLALVAIVAMGCCCGVSRFQALAQLFARGTHPIVAAIAASNTLAAPRVHFVLGRTVACFACASTKKHARAAAAFSVSSILARFASVVLTHIFVLFAPFGVCDLCGFAQLTSCILA